MVFNNEKTQTAEEKQLLRLPNELFLTQLQIEDFTIRITMKAAGTNRKGSKKK